jgi:transcriptional regulator with XRE-family HTH domain
MSPLQFRIRDLRQAKGWSQARLAHEANTRQATISGLETGATRRIELDVLDRIARALGVTAEGLVERELPRRRGK